MAVHASLVFALPGERRVRERDQTVQAATHAVAGECHEQRGDALVDPEGGLERQTCRGDVVDHVQRLAPRHHPGLHGLPQQRVAIDAVQDAGDQVRSRAVAHAQ